MLDEAVLVPRTSSTNSTCVSFGEALIDIWLEKQSSQFPPLVFTRYLPFVELRPGVHCPGVPLSDRETEAEVGRDGRHTM